MLTKDLLRFGRSRQDQIFPRFLSPEDRVTLQLAESLSALYEVGQGQSREELAEQVQPIINGHRSPLIAKGLNKLLLDRCRFREPDGEVEAFRAQLFATAADLLTHDDPNMNDLSRFRAAVADRHQRPPDELAAALYGDLPLRQPLEQFKTVTAERLIHRYNLAQAQGLLFSASVMMLTFDEPDVGRRRFFFQHLKFFRLMTRVYRQGKQGYRLELDGPLSLFDQTRKYGLRLASFLPVVPLLSRWSLRAEIKPDDRAGALSLTQDDGLVSHYRLTTTHVPEEFEVFSRQFKEKAADWNPLKHPTLLDLGRQEVAVPDFTFRHTSGQVVHLELFHPWHKAALDRRLNWLENLQEPPPLALGVDRALSKEPSLLERLEKSERFQRYGFLFNAFPPVTRVVDCLDRFLEKNAEQMA